MSKIKNIFYVILVRSAIFIGILILLIANLSYITRLNKKRRSAKKKEVIAIIKEPLMPDNEFKAFTQGVKDGLIYRGFDYDLNLCDLPTELFHDSPIILTINTDRTLKIIKECLDCTIIGFNCIEKNFKNYTGIYGAIQWDVSFPIFKYIIPHLHHLGVLYDSENSESKKQLEHLIHYSEKCNDNNKEDMSLFIYPIPIAKTIIELSNQLENMPQIDGIYIVERDKVVYNQLKKISALCQQNNIPLIGGGFNGPKIGTIASFTFDPYNVGRQMSSIVNKLNQGKSPHEIEVIHLKPNLYINSDIGYRFGIRIPAKIKEQAIKIYSSP